MVEPAVAWQAQAALRKPQARANDARGGLGSAYALAFDFGR
jgi:hypothetical protein